MAESLFGTRGKIWSRRIKSFWAEYSHNKIGLVGLAFVLIYSFVAIFAPLMTPYDPITGREIASGFAMPQWVTVFSPYKDLPPNMIPAMNWTASETLEFINIIESGGNNLVVLFNGTGEHSISFATIFLYPYSSPRKFAVRFELSTENVTAAQYSLELFMVNPVGQKFLIWAPKPLFSSSNTSWTIHTIYSTSDKVLERLEIPLSDLYGVAQKIFTEKGEYKLLLQMRFRSTSENGTAKINFEDTSIKIFGLTHGILGTDSLGRDVFSQIIYGSRISLAIGLVAAFLSTAIGISVGIIAGYIGGVVDEGIMRTVDILLCLPVLPLLLALVVIFGTNVWYLVIIIAVFGWQGLSRIIRSRVLSLKEMPFIESAKASGGSRFYIMIKHMLPNVIPVALASLILSVPAAILTEAAISFIGLGDPTQPTWGKTLHYAFRMGGFRNLAWWWILPPGAAITTLTLAFVFIGHAVDEVVNPRLRRRR